MSKINDVVNYFHPAASKFEQWACESEASEDYRQMTLSEDVSVGPAVVVRKEISVRWTSLSESGELEWTN